MFRCSFFNAPKANAPKMFVNYVSSQAKVAKPSKAVEYYCQMSGQPYSWSSELWPQETKSVVENESAKQSQSPKK